MNLPRKLKVGDNWYSIEVVEAMREKGYMGRVYYPEQKIKIGKKSAANGRKFSKADMHDTFWHEVVHAILADMGEHQLNNNERFVEEFSARLAKAIQTARF